MKKFLLMTVLLLMPSNLVWAGDLNKKVVDHLQSIAVTVEVPNGSGSGVIKTRVRGDEKVSFVWTAGHVVTDLRKIHTVVDSKTGSTRTVVSFDDAKVVQVLVENGRTIGRLEMFAEVIRFSESEDLALLRVRKKNFSNDSVQFYLDRDIPNLGTGLVHIGSLLGEKLGSNSLTTGILSQIGRLIDGKIFDQTTVVAFPGSSGGGVYLESGQMIGMLLRGSGENFNFICPTRRIVEWAKSTSVLWAVDDSVVLPSDKDLKLIPVEDNGISFEAKSSSADRKPATPHAKTMQFNNYKFIKCLPL